MMIDHAERPPSDICANCGAPFPAGDRFCAECGSADRRPAMPRRYDSNLELPPDRWRPGLKSMLALAILLIVGGLATVLIIVDPEPAPDVDSQGTELHTITGTITLRHPDITAGAMGCQIPPPNQALTPGAPITVIDHAGATIATGQVLVSELVGEGVCNLNYVVVGVPDAEAYRLVISGTETPEVSRALLDLAGWRIDIRLSDLQEGEIQDG
jgi:hypothetical protein